MCEPWTEVWRGRIYLRMLPYLDPRVVGDARRTNLRWSNPKDARSHVNPTQPASNTQGVMCVHCPVEVQPLHLDSSLQIVAYESFQGYAGKKAARHSNSTASSPNNLPFVCAAQTRVRGSLRALGVY